MKKSLAVVVLLVCVSSIVASSNYNLATAAIGSLAGFFFAPEIAVFGVDPTTAISERVTPPAENLVLFDTGTGSVSLNTTGVAVSENFNSLSNTAGSTTNTTLPTGWYITETGGGARDNEQYAVDTGGSNTGDTYSYGAAAATDRALGGLQSGTLIPTVGAQFTNNTGVTITSLGISYAGEQWRIGNIAAARDDRLNFQYSTDATDLTVGTFSDLDALDFTNPIKTAAAAGALDGNAVANRAAVSSSIPGLSIAPGATFWIRWNSFDATGADDGLSVDDFSVTPNPTNPTLSVSDVTQAETNAGTTIFSFTVSLSAPALSAVTFDIATADGTGPNSAQDGNPVGEDNDYVANSSSRTILAGTSADPVPFQVAVNGDTTVEGNETFFVNVTNITNAANTSDQGVGTITNDDGAPVKIHDIQGNGVSSPLNGVSVSTTGVVTARKSNGFFIQEPDAGADADPNTSEGVFVFTSTAPIVSTGDFVSVTGTATEFLTFTEITSSNANVIVATTGNPLPNPIVLTTTNLSPAGPLNQLEKFESMRVSAPIVRSVAPTNGFGEIFTVLDGVPRPFREPGIDITLPVPPDPTSGLVDPGIPRWDRNPERIMIDSDGLTGSSVLNVTSNVTLNNIVGPLDFTFDDYKIDPETAPIVASPNMTAVPVRATTGSEFSIAGFNIENFTNNATQRQKAALGIRTVMNLPDVIGTIEILDLASLQALADQVNNDVVGTGGSNPVYTAYLVPAPLGGSQNVGYLVKTSRVQVDSVTQERGAETYINPVNGNPELLHDRPPLVLKATVNPATDPHPIIVVVNHLRSFIDIELVGGDGVRVRAKRKAQGESTAGLLQELQTLNPGTPVVSVGDYNSYQFNDGYTDPVATIKGTPTADEFVVVDASPDLVNPNFINLTDSLPADQQYSFIFEGTPQALDHVIVNNSANAILKDFKVARMNSDFARSLLGSNASIPEGNSDHDSPVAYFKFSLSRVVDNLTDDVGLNVCTTAPGDCSLRGAISSANDGDTITFAPNLFLPEAPQTITLIGGEIAIADDLTITGPGADQLTINAGLGENRIFLIDDPTLNVTISGVSLTDGGGFGGGINSVGGAIFPRCQLTLDGVHVFGNSTVSGGGVGLVDAGPYTIKNSTINNNVAVLNGGGIDKEGIADLTVTNSTISGNTVLGSGAPGGLGGGMSLLGDGNVTVRNSTFTGNSAGSGGGIGKLIDNVLSLGSTIVAGNSSTLASANGPDISSPLSITSAGFNLIGDNSTVEGTFPAGSPNANGDFVGTTANPVNALLGPLQNNGGPTQTHKPATGFPGQDKGCAFGSATDQRGMPRTADWPNITNGSCDATDIGSVEILIPTAGGVVVAGRVVTVKGVGLGGVHMTLTDSDSNTVEVFTNTAGFYVFEDISAGETYTLTPQRKSYIFTPQILMVEDNMEGVNFVGQSNAKRVR